MIPKERETNPDVLILYFVQIGFGAEFPLPIFEQLTESE